jgi:hypothetical protein
MAENRGFISGFIGGVLGGILVSHFLKPTLTFTRKIIDQQLVDPNATITLISKTFYKFAIIIFHGNGEHEVQLTIVVGEKTYTMCGDEQAIEVLTDENIEIYALNTDITNPHYTTTIEIIYLAG